MRFDIYQSTTQSKSQPPFPHIGSDPLESFMRMVDISNSTTQTESQPPFSPFGADPLESLPAGG